MATTNLIEKDFAVTETSLSGTTSLVFIENGKVRDIREFQRIGALIGNVKFPDKTAAIPEETIGKNGSKVYVTSGNHFAMQSK